MACTGLVDHIVYATADLERGMDEIARLSGVRPVPGGRHPDFGTHNALLSLGPSTYLEVIARDPDLPMPGQGALTDLLNDQVSRLKTWVLRTDDIARLASIANSAGIAIGSVRSGSRQTLDGSTLTWQLTDPYAMPMGGAIPFLISWSDTTHPATVAPRGGELISLTIEHPDVDRVRESMSVLGVDVEVLLAEEFSLVARIQTNDGVKILC